MNAPELPPELPTVPPRRRVWPYIVCTAGLAALVSAYVCYRWWTWSVPPEMDDSSSFLGELIVKIVMVVLIGVSTVLGGLLGWLIGHRVRVLLERRDRSHPSQRKP